MSDKASHRSEGSFAPKSLSMLTASMKMAFPETVARIRKSKSTCVEVHFQGLHNSLMREIRVR